MYYLKYSIVTIIFIIMLQGCSQKILIKSLKSAKVTDKAVRNISVNTFTNDTISQSLQINSALGNVIINNKKYFTLIDRKNIDKVLIEKRLNDSGLVDLNNQNLLIGLKEVTSILTGTVLLNTKSSTQYYEKRTDFSRCVKWYTKNNKKYCSNYRKYTIYCKSNIYNVKTKINLIKISNSKIIFTKTYSKNKKYSHCSDDNTILPSKRTVNTNLAKGIANNLILDIAPSYVYYNVELLDSVKINISSTQKKKFKLALKMIELKRIKKANKILNYLNKELHNLSYVVLYDLAITEESLGNLNKALSLLNKAENITLVEDNLIDEISISIKRLTNNIKEVYKAKQQIDLTY